LTSFLKAEKAEPLSASPFWFSPAARVALYPFLPWDELGKKGK
jgi:hypothetical protein